MAFAFQIIVSNTVLPLSSLGDLSQDSEILTKIPLGTNKSFKITRKS